MTHLRHGLLLQGEGDVGAAAVLGRGAGVALDGGLGSVGAPTLPELHARLHEAVAFTEGHAALAGGTPASDFGAEFARPGSAPHLPRKTGFNFKSVQQN